MGVIDELLLNAKEEKKYPTAGANPRYVSIKINIIHWTVTDKKK